MKRAHEEEKKNGIFKEAGCMGVGTDNALSGTSYILSYFDHDACSEITTAVVTTCIAIAVSYEAKSYGEKNSRNKYGIDENVHRITSEETETDAAEDDALG